jgi:hypothetical protein
LAVNSETFRSEPSGSAPFVMTTQAAHLKPFD